MTISFDQLRTVSQARAKAWHGDKPSSLEFAMMELAGEAGEACNAAKKLSRLRNGWAGGVDTIENLKDELADVVICADLVAQLLGIDLGEAVRAKFNATSEKHGFQHRLVEEASRVAELEPKASAFDSVLEVCAVITTPRDDKRADTLVEAVLDKVNECKALRSRIAEADATARKALVDMCGIGTEDANPVNVLAVFARSTADRNKELLSRVEELEAIVAKLPKTADGVPIVPGMMLWMNEPERKTKAVRAHWKNAPITYSDKLYWVSFYSTEAAALAAKGNAPC
jgi:NTP pyrophosphatase (non-canonical NTP hydrolase)